MRAWFGVLSAIVWATLCWAGEPPVRPQDGSSEASLWRQSDAWEADLRTSPLLVRDPALNAYVRGVLCRLAAQRCADFRLYILDIPSFNAAMAPNGAIEVWTGLLLRVGSEDQLAFVLGHEMTHYLRRHSLAGWRRTLGTNGALTVLKIATYGSDAVTGSRIGAFANIADAMAFSGRMAFTRSDEREADDGGFDLMVRAGYRPQECAAIWQTELAEETARGRASAAFSYGNTHPATAERADAMAARADAVVAPSVPPGREGLRQAVGPFRLVWLKEDIALGQYSRSLMLVDRMLRQSPSDGDLSFARGEILRRRWAPGDGVAAQAAYLAALQAGGPAESWRGLGLVRRKLGDADGARDAFVRYLALVPTAEDRAMIETYTEKP